MKTIRKYQLGLVLALALAMAMLAGCGSSAEEEAPEPEPEPVATQPVEVEDVAAEEPEVQAITIGEEAEGVTGITFENNLGSSMKTVSVVAVGGDQEFDLAIEGGTWANGELGQIFFKAAEGTVYDVTLANEELTYVLHNINFAALAKAEGNVTVSAEDGVAYLEYEANGQKVSTLESEKARAQEGEEEAAAEEDYYDPYYEEDVYYEEPVYYEDTYYEEPAYVEPAQTEDQCVTDIVLN